MLKYRNFFIPFFFFLLFGIALIIIRFAGLTYPKENIALTNGDVTPFRTGWYYINDNQKEHIDIASVLPMKSEGKIVLHNTLPDILSEDTVLSIETYHQSLKAYLDGVLIYEYGVRGDSYNSKGFGNSWNLIPIPFDSAGKEIKLELTSIYKGFGQKVYSIFLGNKNAIVFHFFRSHVGIMIFCIVFVILGLLFFVISIMLRFKPLGIHSYGFFYFSIFILMSSVWMITDSKANQFFIESNVEPYLLSFFTFLLLPVPFFLFLRAICIHHKKILDGLCITFLLNFIVDVSLYLGNILDLIYSLPIMHIILAIAIVIIIYICINERIQYKNTDVSSILWGIILMAIFSFFALFQFYNGTNKDNSYLFRFGLGLYIIFLSFSIFEKSISMLNLSAKAKTYQKLAYIDSMTQLSNQSAFSILLAQIPDTINECFSIGFVVFDLNNLKRVNDIYGHSAGDLVIQGLASCIHKTFEPFGQCFRVGGDEFAVVLKNRTEEDIIKGIDKLNLYKEEFNRCHSNPIEMASGYSLKIIDKDHPIKNIKDIYNEADSNMLKDKAKCKDHYRTV